MTQQQQEIFNGRKQEWTAMLEQIHYLNISEKWQIIFTSLCLDRGFRSLSELQLSQMEKISSTDSEAITYLAKQDKKAGLHILEDLSIKIEDEQIRLKAVQLILEKGIKPSKNELNLIIKTATNMKTLFDTKEG